MHVDFERGCSIKLVTLYSRLGTGKTVAEVLNGVRRELPVSFDPRRWIAFGLVLGLIRRIHSYPLFIPHGLHRSHSLISSSPLRGRKTRSRISLEEEAKNAVALPDASLERATAAAQLGGDFRWPRSYYESVTGSMAAADESISAAALPDMAGGLDLVMLDGSLTLDDLNVCLRRPKAEVANYIAEHSRCLIIKK